MKEFLSYTLAAVVAAVVVNGLEQVNPRAALLLATIIILLVLISREEIFAQLGG